MSAHGPATVAPPPPPPIAARDDCLVVENSGRDSVVRLLQDWGGVRCVQVETHRYLGLSKITFVDQAAAAAVAERVRGQVGRPSAKQQGIDVVLAALRATLAAQPGGWVPTLGKNRYVEGVRPSQTIDVGGWPTNSGGQAINGGGQTSNSGGQTINTESQTIDTGSQTIDTGTRAARGVTEHQEPPPRHRRASGGPYVAVGILDTELVRHPYFDDQLDPRGHARDETPRHPDDAWHGTFVAGLIHQIAPHAGLVGQPAGAGGTYLESWTVACAMADLAALGLPLLNISLACRTEDNQAPLIFAAAKAALGRRTLVVAAAGNYADRDGSNVSAPVWPAALDGVVAVGSVRKPPAATTWTVSPYSPRLPWVDVYAPGDDLVSAYQAGTGGAPYAKGSGTSFAAAVVSGALAATMRDDPWRALDHLLSRSPSAELPIIAP